MNKTKSQELEGIIKEMENDKKEPGRDYRMTVSMDL